MPDVTPALLADTTSMIADSVSSTIYSMFQTRVDVLSDGKRVPHSNDLRVEVRLTAPNGAWAALAFTFDRDLVERMVRKIFSEEDLKDPQIYESAAWEVANVVTSGLKTFLNSRGYDLTMDVPQRLEDGRYASDKALAEMVFLPEGKVVEDRALEVDFYLHA